MKKLLFFLLLLTAAASLHAQEKRGLRKKIVLNDSVVKKIENLKDSLSKRMIFRDSAEIRRQLNRNINSYVRLQQERNEKKKKQAYIRIAIGAGLLLVLIAGISRRKRKDTGAAK